MIETGESTPFSEVESIYSSNFIFNIALSVLGIIFISLLIVYIVGVARNNYRLKDNVLNIFGTLVKTSLFSVLVGVLLYVISSYIEGKNEWKRFANAHCTIIEKREGKDSTGIGLTTSGHIGTFFGTSTSQTVYKCDDGVIYTKND